MFISRWAAAAFTMVSAAALTGFAGGVADAGVDYYGAIAISFQTGNLGYAVNVTTPAEAGRLADEQCGGGRDCSAYVYFVNACGAVAEAPDGSLAWAWGVNKSDAEQTAINFLGPRAPKFPSLGSATPSAAHVKLSICTANGGGPSAPGGRTLPRA
ncbi:DUF4189 domain-containing protein [Nocardia sp. NPDC052566]|uniref:DUF4189 domain-containing protein n=1 Tax=Nocardia sp. NPDC052566 TaxID=3364330 RepID=UPI0037CC9816